ncbi:MAG: hypothetical protein A3H28_09175 [Acidobacteria bacterium RIFCSPLOWO2_02_FULL_61_28]|nr:MAG: hypothetical protein A3H28_09175 [Acidobacteria bacterium RIFCSPLOWO2_02_FULL_61_28]
MAHCPECETLVDVVVDEVEEGEIVTCPECGVDLEVVNTNPIELDLAEDEELEEDEEEELDEDEEEHEE